MFDISWSHLMLFGMAAVVLIPSKDLPKVLRTAGRYWGDAQRMARDFRGQLTEALRETELAEIKDTLTREALDIQKSASLHEETSSFNAALNAAAATSGTQPEQRAMATAAVAADVGGLSVPMPPLQVAPKADPASAQPSNAGAGSASNGGANGNAEPRANTGIDIVRPGRGSVAQRAAKAWKRSAAGSSDSGT